VAGPLEATDSLPLERLALSRNMVISLSQGMASGMEHHEPKTVAV
jgi:hypothetical protein